MKKKNLTNRLNRWNTQEINVKKKHEDWNKIGKDELEFALNKSHKWKSPGMDKIPNFWISYFSKGHENLTSLLAEIVEYPDTLPFWSYHISFTQN